MPIESQHAVLGNPTKDLWSLIFEPENRIFSINKRKFSHRSRSGVDIGVAIYIDARTEKSYSWAETRTVALDFGSRLRSLWGWKKGDVLGLFTPNCIDTPAIMFGTIWAGGVVSPANPAYTVEELAFQIKDSGAKALVTQADLLGVATKAALMSGISKDRIMLIGDDKDLSSKVDHFSSCRGNFKNYPSHRPLIEPKHDLAVLCYSSGTTGKPKGVKLSHENMVMNLLQIAATEDGNLNPIGGEDGNGDKVMAVLPYYHVYGNMFA